MRYLPNANQMKEADRYTIQELGVPSLELMERAAGACAKLIIEKITSDLPVCIVCGSGNNGGDGFAIARILHEHIENPIKVVMVGNPERCTVETKEQMRRLEQCGLKTGNEFATDEYSVIVDAIFGVGLSRNIEGRYKDVIEQMNVLRGYKVAVDIPSGISADTGEVLAVAFEADATVTFEADKLGLRLYYGKEYDAKVLTAPIGISHETFENDFDVAYTLEGDEYKRLLPVRKENSHKGTYGKLLVIAGSKGMSGAAYLNGMAAYMSGVGLVQIYTAEENRVILQTLLPEAIITTYENYDEQEVLKLLNWADTVCIGSGIGTGDISKKIVKTCIEHVKVPCVMDADALNIVSEHLWYLEKKIHNHFIITPHMKEMSRLTGASIQEIIHDRTKIMNELIEKYHLTCVLKDARTMVGGKDRRTYLNLTGNRAMAKGGSGDVLAGVIGGLLAQGISAYDAAVLGTYVHGKAGDFARGSKGSYSVLARDLIENLSKVFKEGET